MNDDDDENIIWIWWTREAARDAKRKRESEREQARENKHITGWIFTIAPVFIVIIVVVVFTNTTIPLLLRISKAWNYIKTRIILFLNDSFSSAN